MQPQAHGGSGIGIEVHRLLAGETVPDAEAQRLAGVFCESELGRRAAKASRAEREFDFAFEVEEMILRGQIDLWFEEGGETVLVDYKTDRDTEAPRQDAHFLQLRLYALALERLNGRLPDRAVLFYLRRGEAVPVGLDEHSMRATRESVRAFREAQEKLAFPLREGGHCLRCPYFRGACPAQGPERPEASPSGATSTIRESL